MEETPTVFADNIWLLFVLPCLICVLIRYLKPEILLYAIIIFLINPVDKIQELLSGFMFVAMCPHLVICIIIDTKYI